MARDSNAVPALCEFIDILMLRIAHDRAATTFTWPLAA